MSLAISPLSWLFTMYQHWIGLFVSVISWKRSRADLSHLTSPYWPEIMIQHTFFGGAPWCQIPTMDSVLFRKTNLTKSGDIMIYDVHIIIYIYNHPHVDLIIYFTKLKWSTLLRHTRPWWLEWKISRESSHKFFPLQCVSGSILPNKKRSPFHRL